MPRSGRGFGSEFELKRKIIDKQLLLKQYLADVERIPISGMIRDPLVVHSLKHRLAGCLEQDILRRAYGVIRKLKRAKRHNLAAVRLDEQILGPILGHKSGPAGHTTPKSQPPGGNFKFLFKPVTQKTLITWSKETAASEYLAHIRRASRLRRLSLNMSQPSRNLISSSSHSTLIKKLEKGAELSGFVKSALNSQSSINEITTNTSFRNGVLKSTPQSAGKPSEQSPPSLVSSGDTTPSGRPMGGLQGVMSSQGNSEQQPSGQEEPSETTQDKKEEENK